MQKIEARAPVITSFGSSVANVVVSECKSG